MTGTWNVLRAAQHAEMTRVIHTSSVNALGLFQGQGMPDSFPIDDDHPCRPTHTYGMAKRLAEEMCRVFTATSGIATLCLRPPRVIDESEYKTVRKLWRRYPASEWSPYWEFGAFIDVRDLAEAMYRAVVCDFAGHGSFLVCADDAALSTPDIRLMVDRFYPDVPWRNRAEYDADRTRSLVDSPRGRDILGWAPRHRWHKTSFWSIMTGKRPAGFRTPSCGS